MGRRLLPLALCLAVGLGVGAGWWSAFGDATSLGYRFTHATSPAHVLGVLPELLAVHDYRVHWMLAQRSREQQGFAYDGDHGLVVVHDPDADTIHWFVGRPSAQRQGGPGAATPWRVRTGVEPAGTGGGVAEVRCIAVAPDEVWCILRPPDRAAPWRAVPFHTIEGELRPGRAQEVDDALRERLRASGHWPAHWGK